jgi:hypothetical protein
MRGVMTLAAQEIFKYIQDHPQREFVLRMSSMEIYNEVSLAQFSRPLKSFYPPQIGLRLMGQTDGCVTSHTTFVADINLTECNDNVSIPHMFLIHP